MNTTNLKITLGYISLNVYFFIQNLFDLYQKPGECCNVCIDEGSLIINQVKIGHEKCIAMLPANRK